MSESIAWIELVGLYIINWSCKYSKSRYIGQLVKSPTPNETDKLTQHALVGGCCIRHWTIRGFRRERRSRFRKSSRFPVSSLCWHNLDRSTNARYIRGKWWLCRFISVRCVSRRVDFSSYPPKNCSERWAKDCFGMRRVLWTKQS